MILGGFTLGCDHDHHDYDDAGYNHRDDHDVNHDLDHHDADHHDVDHDRN